MHREIKTHALNGLNESLRLYAADERGSGNANHKYSIDIFKEGEGVEVVEINFQNGPIKEAGVNGISNEVLLAIVIDRMQGFQAGPFASRDNACALTKLDEALMWLQKRTRERIERGVEGTHQK
jgi:hypothetical protein